jgi:hypothetical protein
VRWWRNCTAFGRCWSYWWWDERSRWPPLKIGPNTLLCKIHVQMKLYITSSPFKITNF